MFFARWRDRREIHELISSARTSSRASSVRIETEPIRRIVKEAMSPLCIRRKIVSSGGRRSALLREGGHWFAALPLILTRCGGPEEFVRRSWRHSNRNNPAHWPRDHASDKAGAISFDVRRSVDRSSIVSGRRGVGVNG